jgi:hypothetical protein
MYFFMQEGHLLKLFHRSFIVPALLIAPTLYKEPNAHTPVFFF